MSFLNKTYLHFIKLVHLKSKNMSNTNYVLNMKEGSRKERENSRKHRWVPNAKSFINGEQCQKSPSLTLRAQVDFGAVGENKSSVDS